MSNLILTYNGWITDCLWLCSANGESAKSIDRDASIMAANIRSTYIKDTCIGITYVVDIWIRCAGFKGVYTGYICAKSAFTGAIKPKALAKSRII